ncbi:hypothetical protein RI054_27g111460 [Pseudoscourfieldia marina]
MSGTVSGAHATLAVAAVVDEAGAAARGGGGGRAAGVLTGDAPGALIQIFISRFPSSAVDARVPSGIELSGGDMEGNGWLNGCDPAALPLYAPLNLATAPVTWGDDGCSVSDVQAGVPSGRKCWCAS